MDGFNFLGKQEATAEQLQGRRLAQHPTGLRAIDREGGVRNKPVKVIIAGMSRTGTFSMYIALPMLGLQPYHMAEAAKMPTRDFEIMHEALEASKKGVPFGREEFDKWVGDYDALCDVPMCLLVKDLIKAYPDAKVILTTRDPLTWRKSIESTILAVDNLKVRQLLSYFSPEARSCDKMMKSLSEAMDGWSIDALHRHNAGVRAVVPKDRLLEFKLGQDGWKEICEFLDVPTVGEEFPRTNDSSMFVPAHYSLLRIWAWQAMKAGAMRFVPLVGLAVAVWYGKSFIETRP